MLKVIGIAALGVTAVCAVGLSTLAFAAEHARRHGRRIRPIASDAVIILGAYTDGFRPSPPLTSRLRAGLHLYRCGLANYFIVSGGRGEDETVSEASSMKRFLVLNGVPPEVILMERYSTDTWENLRNSKEVMELHNLKSCIVVTSDYHLPRAMAVAQQLALQASGYSARSQRAEFKSAIREVLARLKYTVNGQTPVIRKES